MTEDEEERIAIIAEGCKISQEEAEAIYARQIKPNPFVDVVARLKEKAQLQNARRAMKHGDGKMKAAGD